MILVFGKTGQVAKELQNFGSDVLALGRDMADLSNPITCKAVIKKLAPKVVINAAAYTSVEKSEENEDLATIINGHAPFIIAQTCAEINIPLVHISSDYVFEGSGELPWKPWDKTIPQNAYGRSKLVGEKGILSSGANYVILRTSWVISAHGNNFVKNMLHLSNSHDTLNIVGDQIGGPTPASCIASACLIIAKQIQQDPLKSGIYHYSGKPNVSWAELATKIFTGVGQFINVNPIKTSEYSTIAKRPLNSQLDCSTTISTFGIEQPDWHMELKNILKDLM